MGSTDKLVCLALLLVCFQLIVCQRPPNPNTRPNGARPRRPPALPELVRPQRQQLPEGQNRPPVLERGQDLLGFEIDEDTPVGSVVYTLKGTDPEGAKVLYSISGDHFSVNRETGVITLRSPLDREREDLLDVIVTIQDEAFQHIIPFRRQIRVVDKNDNVPTFVKKVYKFEVDETVSVGDTLFTQIGVSDDDSGINAIVRLSCDAAASPEACDKFDIKAQVKGFEFLGGL